MELAIIYLWGVAVTQLALSMSDEQKWKENRVGGWMCVLCWPVVVPAFLLGIAIRD